ncbi:hypothetical protein A2U01_0074352, partial [Trifolium medium]|nr:hypothetical protein [Trifolium medium]
MVEIASMEKNWNDLCSILHPRSKERLIQASMVMFLFNPCTKIRNPTPENEFPIYRSHPVRSAAPSAGSYSNK